MSCPSWVGGLLLGWRRFDLGLSAWSENMLLKYQSVHGHFDFGFGHSE